MREALRKALHKVVMKAYKAGQQSVSKEHAVRHIVKDLEDPNQKAQVPASHVPAASQSVLHKEMKPGQAVSEAHNQKQMNAQAKLGMRPGQGMAAPKMGAAPKMAPAAGAGKAPAMAGAGKAQRPLAKFMAKRAAKKGSEHKTDGVDKFVERQKNKPRIKGVHTSVMPSKPGVSDAGAYVPRHGMGSNLETSKRLHREKLKEQKAMPKPNLPKAEKKPKAKLKK